MSPVDYAVMAVVGMFFLLIIGGGVIVFVVILLRTLRGIQASLDSATQALKDVAPMLKADEITRLANAMILMGKLGTGMLQKMEGLDKTISLFYNFAVARGDLDTATPAAGGGGRFSAYSEERAAASEAAREAQEAKTQV